MCVCVTAVPKSKLDTSDSMHEFVHACVRVCVCVRAHTRTWLPSSYSDPASLMFQLLVSELPHSRLTVLALALSDRFLCGWKIRGHAAVQ